MSFHSSRRDHRPHGTGGRAARRAHNHHDTDPQAAKARGALAPREPVWAPSPITPEIAQAIAASPFAALGLSEPIVRAIVDERYESPSPVQAEVIPHVLAGRDVLACAQTGTGKTAAFVLPILQRLAAEALPQGPKPIRALVLTPTRELAAQITERATVYGRYLRLRHTVVYGGVNQHRQEIALRAQPDLLVATPGRLLDLLRQGLVKLDGVTHFVVDEADRMLDMGFLPDVRRIFATLPSDRRILLFSATMPATIEALAKTMLRDPVRIAIAPTVTTAESVDQSVMFVSRADKRALLETVLRDDSVQRALVFTRTKHGASRLSEQLDRAGITALAIHGDKTQSARERALDAFRRGSTRVLVATDVAARGIDVDGISHVINFDLPNVAESYVHRIGRTGRGGAVGRAISFCDREERSLLSDIERYIRRRLPVSGGEPPPEPAATPTPSPATNARRPRRYRGTRFR
ncbi:DEAD/DEAH box helicase [Pendulispora albinea]|uniref:DEAD/DEAH box helicase n=1 Tax=Pendulispora albinea TaxID=2741071 RepID=A0ABZ2MBM1_9BACT